MGWLRRCRNLIDASSTKARQLAARRDPEERALALGLLRFSLDALLTHPEYLDPSRIDDGLLLREDNVAGPSADTKARRRKRKADIIPS